MQKSTCCFFGHREINETKELTKRLYSIIENLILEKGVDTFLFGSKSRFNNLCYEQVTKIKKRFPHIKRIYVRAEFPHINDSYLSYLLERYENTYFPEHLLSAGKAIYVERNQDMIDNSHFCVVYYEETYSPQKRKSGTKLALDYAVKENKQIIKLKTTPSK